MDDHEARNLRLICDEVFGESCFVAQLIWKSRQNKDNRTINGISVDHEYILVYSKHAGMRVFRGADRDENSYKNPDNDPKGPWTSANMVGLATAAARPNLHYDLIDPATGINYGCPDKGWRYDRAVWGFGWLSINCRTRFIYTKWLGRNKGTIRGNSLRFPQALGIDSRNN